MILNKEASSKDLIGAELNIIKVPETQNKKSIDNSFEKNPVTKEKEIVNKQDESESDDVSIDSDDASIYRK